MACRINIEEIEHGVLGKSKLIMSNSDLNKKKKTQICPKASQFDLCRHCTTVQSVLDGPVETGPFFHKWHAKSQWILCNFKNQEEIHTKVTLIWTPLIF